MVPRVPKMPMAQDCLKIASRIAVLSSSNFLKQARQHVAPRFLIWLGKSPRIAQDCPGLFKMCYPHPGLSLHTVPVDCSKMVSHARLTGDHARIVPGMSRTVQQAIQLGDVVSSWSSQSFIFIHKVMNIDERSLFVGGGVGSSKIPVIIFLRAYF